MPHHYPAEVRQQVIELARSGTKVAQLVETFGISDAAIYNWLKQEKIDPHRPRSGSYVRTRAEAAVVYLA